MTDFYAFSCDDTVFAIAFISLHFLEHHIQKYMICGGEKVCCRVFFRNGITSI